MSHSLRDTIPSPLLSIKRALTRVCAVAAALPPAALGLISATGAARPSPAVGLAGAALLWLLRMSTLFWALAAGAPPDAVGLTSAGGRAVTLAGACAKAAVHASVARAARMVCFCMKGSFDKTPEQANCLDSLFWRARPSLVGRTRACRSSCAQAPPWACRLSLSHRCQGCRQTASYFWLHPPAKTT